MTQSASQAAAFYREVAKTGVVWTVRDERGFPQPLGMDGRRAQPFWSSESRVRRLQKSAAAYRGFEPVQIAWKTFVERWVPGLTRDGVAVGVNWTGEMAQGYDVAPIEALESIEALRNQRTA